MLSCGGRFVDVVWEGQTIWNSHIYEPLNAKLHHKHRYTFSIPNRSCEVEFGRVCINTM